MPETVTLTQQEGGRPAEGDTICLTLDGLTVDRLLSVDPLGHRLWREGVLVCDIGGQNHTLNWSTGPDGRLVRPDRYRDFVLFAGVVEHGLQASVSLVEVDGAQFSDFSRISGHVLDVLAGCGALAGPYGPAAAAGSVLVKSLLQYIAAHVRDDLELAFLGDLLPAAAPASADSGAAGGRFRLERNLRDSPAPPGIRIGFQSRHLAPSRDSRPVCLFLEEASIELKRRPGPAHRLVVDGTFGAGKGHKPFRLDYGVPLKANRLGQLVRVRNQLVYSGPWHGLLPFFLDVSVVFEEGLDKVQPIMHAGQGLYEQLLRLDGESGGDVRDAAKRFDVLASAGQSLLSLALAFVPGKESVGTVSGLLVRGPEGAHQAAGGSVRTVQPGLPFKVTVDNGSGDRLGLTFRLVED